jgi:hypothetical protein
MFDQNVALMMRIFSWFNTLADPSNDVRIAQVEQFFTEDARMSTNGVIKCQGTDAFLRHFIEIRDKLEHFEVRPIRHSLADAEHVAAVYDIAFETRDGAVGTICANVLWTVRNNRVADLEEWTYTRGAEIEFDAIA